MSRLYDASILNRECFGGDDYYSDISELTHLFDRGQLELLTVSKYGKTVGYILFQDCGTHLESLRRGLTKEFRGHGLGITISKKLIKVAKERGKSIHTYVSKSNLPSLNSNFKVGYKVTGIGEHFIYIQYEVK